MFISIFDLFKIGIGPSSSHTMGPMVAANMFLDDIIHKPKEGERIRVTFYGSLAFTGKGHASDRAVILGLMGQKPDSINPDEMDIFINQMNKQKSVAGFFFDPDVDIVFDYGAALDTHPNGMIFSVLDKDGKEVISKAYFSIGGGFVIEEGQSPEKLAQEDCDICKKLPYPYQNSLELLSMAKKSGFTIAQVKMENEKIARLEKEIYTGINNIWQAMNDCIERGLKRKGVLPGSLNIKRRAADIKVQLDNEKGSNIQYAHICNEWLSVYAMAVNEENAAGGRVVTAPTNGAAGVIPAVLRYYFDFVPDAREEHISVFLLTAAAIGGIIKRNASISGAEVGCQGEVGSASAMAAAGLCAVMGGTNEQIENAAEIALEHHLGMTCDPVAGLVQVPCIERNGLGAVKAVTAASLALRGTGEHFVPLDSCIETMRQTGLDMRSRYKETSRGGLAVNVIEC